MPSEDYVKGRTLGEGTWGRVYEANRKKDNVIVAVKRIKQNIEGKNDGGVSFSALREVKYLRELRHRNIIEVFISVIFLYIYYLYSSWMCISLTMPYI